MKRNGKPQNTNGSRNSIKMGNNKQLNGLAPQSLESSPRLVAQAVV